MKIIINKFIPFHGYITIIFFNIIFWRKEYSWYLQSIRKNIVINHENIHEAQMRDFCKWIPIGGLIFYILYLFEWIWRVLFTKDFMSKNAYKHITFEMEANKNENNLKYLTTRKKFAQYK